MYIELNLILNIFGFKSHFIGIFVISWLFPLEEYFSALSGTFKLKWNRAVEDIWLEVNLEKF